MTQLITRWNPHFVNLAEGFWVGKVPRETYLRSLRKFIKTRHALFLTGVRRSGKSTLMHQLMQELIEKEGVPPINVLYINFEDLLVAPYLKLGSELLDRLYTFYKETYNPQGKVYLFLDELQGVKDFNRWMNTYYESQAPLKIIASGSQRTLLEAEKATLMTGRNIQMDIYPLNFYEYLQLKKVSFNEGQNEDSFYRANLSQVTTILHHLNNYLFEGGFPEIVLEQDGEVKKKIANTYYRDLVTRDVLLPNNLRNGQEVEILGLQLLSDFAHTHTYSSLAKPQKLSPDTVKTYLAYFSKAYLFFECTFFSYKTKETQDIQKPRKIYVVDNGMRNFNVPLARLELGRLAENMVYTELLKTSTQVSYWKGKREVDFLKQNGALQLFNVSYTDELSDREVEGLIEGLQEFNLKEGVILTKNHFATTEIQDKTVKCVPLWVWLLANGKPLASEDTMTFPVDETHYS